MYKPVVFAVILLIDNKNDGSEDFIMKEPIITKAIKQFIYQCRIGKQVSHYI